MCTLGPLYKIKTAFFGQHLEHIFAVCLDVRGSWGRRFALNMVTYPPKIFKFMVLDIRIHLRYMTALLVGTTQWNHVQIQVRSGPQYRSFARATRATWKRG